jgi:flagellin
MSNSVVTNVSAMAAVRTLSSIATDMQSTQARVETGLKVNSASDNPAVFAIAQGMRSDISGLQAVSDGLGFGSSTLSNATAAATKISDELNNLKATVIQGQQQGLDQTQIQAQIDAALKNINTYAQTSTSNGVNLLVDPADPNNSTLGITATTLNVVQDVKGNTLSIANQNVSSSGLGLAGLDLNQASMQVTFDQSMAFANGDQVTLVGNDGAQYVFEFNDGSAPLTSQPVADDPSTTGTSERVQVFDVQYDATTQSPLQGVGALIDRIKSAGFGASLSSDGTLTITGAVDAAASVTATSIAAGATAAVAGGSTTAIATIDAAIKNVNGKLAALGAATRQIQGLQDFTKSITDATNEGLGALVDADLAEESAKLQSLQTRNQLAIQSLSIANQAPQALLSLFR